MPKLPDPLRTLLTPLLPEGLDFEDLQGEVEGPQPLWEALDPLAALTAKDTERRLERRKGIVSPPAYRRALRAQQALRDSYRRGLDALLTRAEKLGPRGRDQLLTSFRTLSRSHLERSHRLGLRLTATGPALKAKDQIWSRYLDERSNNDALHFRDFMNTIWEKKEVMPRDQRRDLYSENLDSMFNQGAITGAPDDIVVTWRLSPAEHCMDCIGLAATAEYSKPGTESDLPTLPTVPRRGDTQCLARCKCFLTYNSERTGEPLDPTDKPGVSIEDGDEPLPSERRLAVQEQADQLHRDMLYYKAQHALTGEREWLFKRKAANDALIRLQDGLDGGRFVPRSTSDAMVRVVREAQDGGWTPATAADAAKFAKGQYAGVVEGTNFHRGLLKEWDQQTGRGVMETLSGQDLEVGTNDAVQTIMLGRKLAEIPAKPWSIVDPPIQDAVVADVPGRANAVAEVVPATSKVDTSGVLKAAREAIESRPTAENHGLNVWVMPPKGRRWKPDSRRQFGTEGVELIGRNVVALRGAAKANTQPGSVRSAVLLGTGARIFSQVVRGSRHGTTWSRHMSGLKRFLSENGRGDWLINSTVEEAAFAATYQIFVEEAVLLVEFGEIVAFMETVLSEVETGALSF